MDNIDQLKKLAQIFNTDKIISKEEIDGILAAIVQILANNKRSVDETVASTQRELENTLETIITKHNEIIQSVGETTRTTKDELTTKLEAELAKALAKVDDLVAEAKSVMPENGKDADPEEVANIVLARLPEQKDFILSKEEVANRISELDEDEKELLFTNLGSKKLTSLQEGFEERIADAINRVRLTRGIKDIVAGSNVTVIKDDNGVATVSATGGGGGGGGITSINADTTAAQLLTVGTSGTDFAIADDGTGTHTFNLPTASATNRGALSSADWTTFNDKFSLPSLTAGSVLFSNGTTIAQDNANFFWDDTNNRLGIGTTSPAQKLHVYSTSTGGTTLTLENADTGGRAWSLYSTGSANTPGAGFLGLYNGSSYSLVVNGSSGNVGIGTTGPSSLLHVSGAGAEISLQDSTSGGTRWVLLSRRAGIQGLFSLYDYTNSRDILTANSSGNVGIGTATPATKFDVLDGTGRFQIGSVASGYMGLSFNGSLSASNYNFLSGVTDKTLYFNRPTGYSIHFRENNVSSPASQMTLASGGNVGIGITSPGAKLDVSGAILGQRLVEANTAGSGSPNIITAGESRTLFTNEGATALNYETLPTAAVGLSYTFYVQDADGIRVTANTGDVININGVASSTAGYCQSTNIGSSVTLTAINATDWVATSVVGTWTLA